LTGREFTKILDWPGYRVYRHEIDEEARTLKLWVRRKRGNKVLICSGCGGRCWKIEEIRQRRVRDLPWRKYQTFVVVEFYRVRCPKCGLKVEAVPQLPSKAPFTKDFEDAVGLACESAAARQLARRALSRIENGTFGACLHCEQEVSQKRLTAVPWVPFCLACQEAADHGDERVLRTVEDWFPQAA